MCVGGVLTIFYSPQAPMKMVWIPLLLQINITEQCETLCKRQIIFGNPPESKWVLTLGQNEYNNFFWLHVNQFIVVVSLFRKVQVRGEWLSQWRCYSTDFLRFSELKFERKRVHFSRIFLYYIDIHMVYENVLPCAHIYPGLLM